MYIEEGAGEYGKKWGARVEDLGEKERGGLSVVLFQVCIRFVFQSIMFGVRRAPKACPIQKKEKKKERDAREKEEERGRWRAWKGRETGGYLAEIVMSCYYHARQLSRRNTRGPLPIKLSSRWESIARAQTHAENDLSSPLSSPPPQRQIKAERSNGPSRDQFARLSYIPIDLLPLVNS